MLTLWSRLGRLLVSWTMMMTFAGAAAYGLATASTAFMKDLPGGGLQFSLPFAALMIGLIAGILQRTHLRPYWTVPPGWAWASMLGWGIGIPLVVLLSAALREPIAGLADSVRLLVFLVAAGFSGVVASFGQWLYLRRVTRRHMWWLFANAIGWLMAWILVLAFGLFIGGGDPLPASADRAGDALLLGALAGFVIGFEQGIAVMGLFAQQAWDRSRKRPQ